MGHWLIELSYCAPFVTAGKCGAFKRERKTKKCIYIYIYIYILNLVWSHTVRIIAFILKLKRKKKNVLSYYFIYIL